MNDESSTDSIKTNYIETPRTSRKPEKIDTLLARRMREFLLERRRRMWRETGE